MFVDKVKETTVVPATTSGPVTTEPTGIDPNTLSIIMLVLAVTGPSVIASPPSG